MISEARVLVSERLKAWRKANALNQKEFADLAGLNFHHYQKIESGRQQDFDFSTLVRLAAAYGVEPWELLFPNCDVSRYKLRSRVEAGDVVAPQLRDWRTNSSRSPAGV